MDKKYYIIGGVIILLLILAGVFFFSSPSTPGGNGGNGGNGGRIELVWWKPFEDTENVQELINDFQTTYKNISVTFVKKDIVDYEKDLIDALASGTGPDIFSIHNDWLPKHSGKILPMPESMGNVRAYNEAFVDVASADFIKDNRIYAVPLAVDLLGLYYNKEILGSAGISQPPKTWDELVKAVESITRVNRPGTFTRSGIAMGTSNNVNRAVDIVTLMMLQSGTTFYSDDYSRALFDQSEINPSTNRAFFPAGMALEYYTQFANPAKTSYTWNTKSDFSVDAFTQGKVGMMINYSYMMPVIKDKAPNLNWGLAPVPQTSLDANKINFANYWGESVARNSKNAEAAWQFLAFISSKPQLEKYYSKHKQVSSRKDILSSQIGDTEIGALAENALTAKSVYKKDVEVFERVFTDLIDSVILRNTRPEEALKQAVEQINLSLTK